MSDSYAGGKICRVDDLVLNRLKAHLGVFALATTDGVISPDYTVLRSVKSNCNKYFELLYKSPACRRELFVRAKGIVQGFWRLYTDDFYAIQVPVQPLREQHRIVDSIEAQTDGVNKCIGTTNNEICLLQEYRTRLIARCHVRIEEQPHQTKR